MPDNKDHNPGGECHCLECKRVEKGEAPGWIHCRACLADGRPSGKHGVIIFGTTLRVICDGCGGVVGEFQVVKN